ASVVVASADRTLVPDLTRLLAHETSALRDVVERYTEDRGALGRRWYVEYSPERRARLRTFSEAWLARLDEVDPASLALEGRIDRVLLENELVYELALLDREEELFSEMEPLIPFGREIMRLDERRRDREPVEARAAADVVAALPDAIASAREALEARLEPDEEENADAPEAERGDAPTGAGEPAAEGAVSRVVALRAANGLDELRERLEDWYAHYAGYDPLFTWWVKDPYAEADSALDSYVKFLREEIVGYEEGEDEPIVGDPIGADGMAADLVHEMIPYTPEELIAIAEREFAWCEARMLEASRELGYGDDWKAALEHVKMLHREPGDQPRLVRELAAEAVAFLRDRDLITIPPLAEEVWRIEMMSPEMQEVAPFFLGGEVIRVSFPTDGMDHEDKLMSMRGNNIHFSRATVHHELIPGHHLQGFMTDRYHPHRNVFSTPFWGEGWALYWEMRLWDLGFPQTAEDRIGMLFWRMHRAARIIFSLSFHLGEMTPEEAIDFLVERVGHERANAEAEVRRSFNGDYSPLYQVAYMIGGLQIRALHRELVESGRMTEREFHDAILQGGRMPIEMVRARLLGEPPAQDFTAAWRFYGDPLER
ncbi:MAG: DUF885 family protein, partial [Gemmatimonadota bacterium]